LKIVEIAINAMIVLMRSPLPLLFERKRYENYTCHDSVKKVWGGKGNDIEGKSLFDVLPEIVATPFPD
jgi:hypothetical protein